MQWSRIDHEKLVVGSWDGQTSYLEDPPYVLELSTSQAGAFTYAAEGGLSALKMKERCCKVANYKLWGESQQADGRGRTVYNEVNRFADNRDGKAITTPSPASWSTDGPSAHWCRKSQRKIYRARIRIRYPPSIHFQLHKLSAYCPSHPCQKVITWRQKSNMLLQNWKQKK